MRHYLKVLKYLQEYEVGRRKKLRKLFWKRLVALCWIWSVVWQHKVVLQVAVDPFAVYLDVFESACLTRRRNHLGLRYYLFLRSFY